jgi:hypothetical protein
MQASHVPAEFPPLHEIGYSRESLVQSLSTEVPLPSLAVAVATLYAEHIAPDILAVIERARREDLDVPSGRLFFRGLHILGGRRFTAIYQPLIAFLCGPQQRVEDLLGDAITETLPLILTSAFDGDIRPLRSLVTDQKLDSFIREAALKALVFLCFEGIMDRAELENLLRRLDAEKLLTADDEAMWHAWMTAIATLGIEPLVAQVRAAFADGRITSDWCDEDDFDELLAAAIERPDDKSRFKSERMGYIEDVLQELERFHERDVMFGTGDGDLDENFSARHLSYLAVPARNPFRDVGRNDPCPCGSGKKFKKCCAATG